MTEPREDQGEGLGVTIFNREPPPLGYSLEAVSRMLQHELGGPVTFREHHVPMLPSLRALRDGRQARNDVNHIVGGVYFVALGLPSDRTVLTIHDVGYPRRLRPPKRWVYELLWLRLPLHRARTIVCSSEFTRSAVLEYGVDPGRVSVVHLAVDRRFVPSARDFDEECPTILQVGSNPKKNLRRLVRAIRGKRARLWIVGDPGEPARSEIGRWSVDAEVFTDVDTPTLVKLYQECDLVFFASTYEGFGLPILEAQAVGRPLVTSTICSMPEVAGEGACFVDPFEVSEIRDAIEAIRTDPDYRRSIVQAGLENVARFSPRKMAEEYLRIYRAVASSLGEQR